MRAAIFGGWISEDRLVPVVDPFVETIDLCDPCTAPFRDYKGTALLPGLFQTREVPSLVRRLRQIEAALFREVGNV